MIFYGYIKKNLSERFKDILIPPIPEKGLINRFSPEFVEYRRKELERFMKRITNHHTLKEDEALITFIEASDVEFMQYKERIEAEKKGKKGTTVSTFSNFFK